MKDRKYTFTFEGDGMHVETSDGMLDEDQAINVFYWFAREIKPYAPRVAVAEMSRLAIAASREEEEE